MREMMKRLSILYLYAALLPLFASCEKDLEPYSMEECRLNFRYYHSFYDRWMTTEDLESSDDSYRTTVYSFVYAGGVERDTLWFPVQTSGFLSDVSRPIALQQMTVPDTVDNAEEGIHYIAFDDPTVAHLYQVPAITDTLSIPVILLRDKSLDSKDIVLRFGFKDNGVFKPGFESMSYRTIYISARLSMPVNWVTEYVGEWGPRKHELMIQWTGNRWDDDYWTEFLATDSNYRSYINQWLARRLEKENAILLEQGEEPEHEADGTPVEFPPIPWY